MSKPSKACFKDHFSGHAQSYARARPGYPDALFDWLERRVPATDLAWDVGTGNGQVARALSTRFQKVHATDASDKQLAHAKAPANVDFLREPAEASSLDDRSVDLVTAGQSLHWFNLELFYQEVRRVTRPGAVVAAWTYQLNEISAAVDNVVQHFYDDVVGSYWPPERVHVEQAYLDLPFPFAPIETPVLELVSEMALADYVAYLDTWSSVQRYRAREGRDPLELVNEALIEAWGDPRRLRRVRWPLSILAGRILT